MRGFPSEVLTTKGTKDTKNGEADFTTEAQRTLRKNEMEPKILVIDASVIRGAPNGLLRNLRKDFNFLLPDMLIYEILTHRISEWDALDNNERAKRDANTEAQLRRASEEAGNAWFHHNAVLAWEAQTGLPGSDSSAPRQPLSVVDNIRAKLHDPTVRRACCDYDAGAAKMGKVCHEAVDERWLQSIRQLSYRDRLTHLRTKFASEDQRSQVRSDALDLYADIARDDGVQLAPSLSPGPGHLGFGFMLSGMLFLEWKLATYGDEPAGTKKPANAWLDQYYVAFMAIADGMISADKGQLERAWICWPEKESFILRFEGNSATRYQPD